MCFLCDILWSSISPYHFITVFPVRFLVGNSLWKSLGYPMEFFHHIILLQYFPDWFPLWNSRKKTLGMSLGVLPRNILEFFSFYRFSERYELNFLIKYWSLFLGGKILCQYQNFACTEIYYTCKSKEMKA